MPSIVTDAQIDEIAKMTSFIEKIKQGDDIASIIEEIKKTDFTNVFKFVKENKKLVEVRIRTSNFGSFYFNYVGDIDNVIKFIMDHIISRMFSNYNYWHPVNIDYNEVNRYITGTYYIALFQYKIHSTWEDLSLRDNFAIMQERYTLFIANGCKHVTEFDKCIS